MTTLAHLPRLGVGLMYNPALPEFLHTDLDALDYVEITSDMFWTDRGPGAQPRYEELESWTEMLKWMRERRPVVAHNIGLSIGNAGRFDLEYVAHLGEWQRRYGFAWQSDHLSFAEVTSADGADQHAGVAVPLPYDEDVLDLIVERVNRVQELASMPLLLENSVYFVNFRDQDMSEPQFLNALTARTGCGILLDLHNLYCNARNHGFDAFAFLDELDLTRVVEAHIAGGTEFAGMYTDSHSGACPEEVWRLLERLVPRAPNLRGVTFEFHDSYYGRIQREGVRAQLERAREVFS
ncbi:MAG TPA: DUF692 family protein [Thermoanaerobaculia bacterium]|nr:DUF692 family protein [Thermoanaerobaculia bacterium]